MANFCVMSPGPWRQANPEIFAIFAKPFASFATILKCVRNKLRRAASASHKSFGRITGGNEEGFAVYTIVAASQKGGSGKTTLSGHLAVEASRARAGAVALID